MSTVPTSDEQLRAEISARYARTALQVLGTEQPTAADACCAPTCCTPNMAVSADTGTAMQVIVAEQVQTSACCGSSCCSPDTRDGGVITSDLYSQAELGAIPMAAALASLGWGNPTALAELKLGERVLDLGSGGGIDVLLSARRVGPTGFAYGLDMTDAMLELAERNRAEAGVENVRFLKGIIEDIPFPPQSVDVVISNCVINLPGPHPASPARGPRILGVLYRWCIGRRDISSAPGVSRLHERRSGGHASLRLAGYL